MSRKPHQNSPSAGAAPVAKPDMQRVRVDAQGYDPSGAYWGAGPDVFIATMNDGAQEITVRAKSIAEAREKVGAELARPLGTPKAGPREPIGGGSPNKVRFEIDWRDPATGNSARIRITHSRDYLGQGQDHVEVESIVPKKAPLPITETGYRSRFVSPLELVNNGGPVVFVTAWLDREAKGKDWQKRQIVRSQGDLFQWAEAQTEVGTRRKSKASSPKPAAPSDRATTPPAVAPPQASPLIVEAAERMAEFDPAAAKVFLAQPVNRALIAEAFEHGFRKHSKLSALACKFIATALERERLGTPADPMPKPQARSRSRAKNRAPE